MNIAEEILAEAVAAPHGALRKIAERHGYNPNTFRKMVSIHERSLEDTERNEWMNFPAGSYIEELVVVSQARDTLKATAASQPRQVRSDVDDAWNRARREALGEALQVPENVHLIDEQPLVLDYTTWGYCSDLHVPLHSRLFVERLVKMLRYHRIRNLVIGGDLADFDMLSRFPKAQRTTEWRKSSKILGDMVLFLAEYVDELVVVPGNHDRRIQTKLDMDYTMEDIIGQSLGLRQRPRCLIQTTPHDYIYVGQAHEDPLKAGWVAGHPRWFSSTPGKGLTEVADRTSRNALGSHNHIQALMKSKRGFTCIDPGCMLEAELVPYHMASDGLSRFGNWQRGFVLFEDGFPTLCADGLTDWRKIGIN